jgi:hypothetical protein
MHFRSAQQIAMVGPLNIGIIDLQPYEEDVKMTEEQEEELLRETSEVGHGMPTGMNVMTVNPFGGTPTPLQQQFLEALQEADE